MSIFIGVSIAIFLFVILYITMGTNGIIIGILLLLLAGIAAAAYYLSKSILHLDEMEVGVIFNKRTGNFAYFIDSDVKDSEKYSFINNHEKYLINKLLHRQNKFLHFIYPFKEEQRDKITRGSYKGDGEADDLRTKEGIPVFIKWSFSFRLDVTKIPPNIAHKMARALPQNAGNMIKGKALHSLRHIVEQMSISELHQEDARKNLEEKLRLTTLPKVNAFGVIGVGPNNQVQITEISMPAEIEKALKIAHQRRLQTETVTEALNALRDAIRDYKDEDMARLAELERLRIIDEKSAGLVYYMDSFVRKNSEKHVHHHNGPNGHNHGNGHGGED